MKHHSPALRRPGRRRLAVAAAVALAVTAGTAATTGPALAAPHAPAAGATPSAAEQTGPFVIAANAWVRSAGSAGFVTSTRHETVADTYQWNRTADGTVIALPPVGRGQAAPRAAVDGERVATRTSATAYRILDMAGGAPVDLDVSAVGSAGDLWEFTGDTLVMRKSEGNGVTSLHLFSKPGATTVHRVVADLPADARISRMAYSSGDLAVQYRGTVAGKTEERLAVVDLATAKVVENRTVPGVYPNANIALTPTHVAWATGGNESGVTLMTAPRDGSQAPVRRTTLTGNGGYLDLRLMGGWLVYGGTLSTTDLSAVSLKDGTALTGLLRNAVHFHGSGDALTAQGSTAQGGTGVYRIGLGADGRPAATLVANTGATTPTTVVTQQAATTADFRRAGSPAALRWTYGRSDLWVDLRVTHKATGRSWNTYTTLIGTATEAAFAWDGAYSDRSAARNGEYTWKMVASSLSGVGGTVERSGTLRVDSGVAAHGYSDTGSPDLLVRNEWGHLLSYDVRQFLDPRNPDWTQVPHGGGWYVYDRLLSAGNLDASPYSDVLAREKSTGVLWFYSGKGTTLAKRTAVGGGWNAYDKIAAGSDLTGDGRPDLVATDKAGVLWLYKATGDGAKPFAPRKRIGGGWGAYNLITAPGNVGGAASGDLLARDRDGVLWLYLGKGDGTFAPRTRVGGGWGGFGQIVNIGDADRDGHADLIAESGTKRDPWITLFKGTGNWKAPFKAGDVVGIPPYESADTVKPRALPF
ncbi:FG-GAP repeat domain-containing protein [Streptomyces sp. NPDC012421]|uniref:FG-GAP repeat domain-containing protein n=1 Tax=Streptomyces sp. NPDC012421 TaxID=3364832 RepID=UPI0036F15B69